MIANSSASKIFVETVHQLNLHQLSNHASRAANDNILDLVLVSTSLSDLASPVECTEPLGNSDHFSLSLSFHLPRPAQPTTKLYRNFKKADFPSARAYLHSIDWDRIGANLPDVESLSHKITDSLTYAIANFVPLCRVKDKSILPPHLMRLKRKVRRNFRKRHTEPLAYSSARRKYSRALRAHFASEEDSLLQAESLASFYSLVKQKTKPAHLESLSIDDGTSISSDPARVAEIFSDYFASVYTKDDGSLPETRDWEQARLHLTRVSEAAVLTALSKTASKNSCGPDGIPSSFLKGVGPAVAKPLALLFTRSLESGQIPAAWKLTHVTPLYKGKGAPRSHPNSFRPISKASSIAKLVEKIVSFRIMNHLLRFEGVSPRQFGFRPKHSTVTQLLCCLDKWTKALSDKRPTYICYVDYKKAFDSVSHPKLLKALEAKGLSDRLLSWLGEYLRGRTQRVRVGDSFSAPAPISSGVLQGSCIGPVVFLAFIDSLLRDLSQMPSVDCLGFADDIKIFSDNPTALQAAMDHLSNWCVKWQLHVAPQKCHILRIGNGPEPSLSLNGTPISYAASVRDLGIQVDQGLSFIEHCEGLAKAAKRTAFLTLRCFQSGRAAPLLRAYTTYVRPKLEYATQVFAPARKKDSDCLERVQRYYTRRLFAKCGLKSVDYEQRLRLLSIDRLDVRRAKLDLLLCYKIFHGLTDGCDELLSTSFHNRTARHQHHLVKELSGCLARRTFFSNRVVSMWNQLPVDIALGSEENFKSHIAL